MEYLITLQKKSPDIQSIDLSGKKITDLTDFIPVLLLFNNLTSINLSENEIKTLPPSITKLSKITNVNINNNLFDNFQSIVILLKKFPLLTSITLNLDTNDEVKYLLENLPNIKYLNGQEVTNEDLEGLKEEENSPNKEENEIESIPNRQKEEEFKQNNDSFNDKKVDEKKIDLPQSINKQNDLGKITELMQNVIKLISNTLNKNQIMELSQKFENLVVETMDQIQSQNEMNNFSEKNSMTYKGLLTLYSFLLETVIAHIEKKDNQSSIILNEIFKCILSISNELISRAQNRKLNEQINASANNQSPVREKELLAQLEEKHKELERYKKEKLDFLSKNTELENENKRLLQALIKHSKEQSSPSSKEVASINQPRVLRKEEPLNEIEYTPKTASKIQQMSKNIQKPLQGGSHAKVLSLKQLKELIQDMFTQKQKYDEKCVENKLPRETMEQYMYTYLNQRYGLKSLIIEWATSIINGIKQFSNEDSDVSLFGKILRNECDEDFRFIQSQLKNAMQDVIKDWLKKKYKLKTDNELLKMRNDIVNGYIEDQIWIEIIKRMYNEEHFSILEQKIQQFINDNRKARPEGRKISREELNLMKLNKEAKITFNSFQKIVLDFQLKSHEKYIKDFINIFKEFDTDTNGIINEGEFRGLVGKMNICNTDEEIDHLLQIVDPYANQSISFSEALSLFSSEFANQSPIDSKGQGKQITLLEKFLSNCGNQL